MLSLLATVHSTVGSKTEEIALHLLVQLLLIIGVTRMIVWVGTRLLGQTSVAGEILAGLVLGPSALGLLAPGLLERIFVPSTAPILVGFAQVGLVLLMFQIGLEFEFGQRLSRSKRAVAFISLAGVVLPFMLGFLCAPWFWKQMPAPLPSLLSFRLFFATAMSITAIPILGRIFMELSLSHTRTAALTIAAAAIDDILGWLLLGVVGALVSSHFSFGSFLGRVGGLALYLAVVLLVVRPLLKRLLAWRRARTRSAGLPPDAISLVLVLVFCSAAVTSALGVFAIIGGFAMGLALHDDRVFVAEWKQRVAPLVQALLLPVFFTYTGLRTDIGTLSGAGALVQCVLICAIAFAGKFGGAFLAARLTGESPRSALTIGVCMNTRALMELIALNVGYDLGILSRQLFTMLVIMALVSTFIATPLIRRLMAAERRLPAANPIPLSALSPTNGDSREEDPEPPGPPPSSGLGTSAPQGA